MKKAAVTSLSLAMVVLFSIEPLKAVTTNDFDGGPGTPFTLETFGDPPGPSVSATGGVPGGFLQLTEPINSQVNYATFDMSDPGAFDFSNFSFDFKIEPPDPGVTADGFSFSYADTAIYGTSGPIASSPFTPEDPAVDGVLGFGFDTWSNEGAYDEPGIGTGSDYNDISLFWNNELVPGGRVWDTRTVLSPPLQLDDGEWHRVTGNVDFAGATVDLNVDGNPVFSNHPVPPALGIPLAPFQSRIMMAARTGGENEMAAIDNLNVHFSNSSLAKGLMAYWPLDGNFADCIDTYHGEERGTNPILFDTGMFGQGIVLDGDDQYVEITGGPANGLDFVNSPMTVSAWFRVDAFDTSWQALIAKGEQDGWRIHRRGDEDGMAFTAGEPDTPSSVGVNDGAIHHLVAVSAPDPVAATPNGQKSLYIDGVLVATDIRDPIGIPVTNNRVRIGDNPSTSNREWEGLIDDVAIWNRALTGPEIATIFGSGASIGDIIGREPLRAGDADMDGDFDTVDLVTVQIAAKYLTGAPATWGEGDWNGAPGGCCPYGPPPAGDGVFDQLDIVAALSGGAYLTGKYCSFDRGGTEGDSQTSIIYDANTGQLGVDAPASTELTSINIDSASGILTGDAADNLGGSFDNEADDNIFKAIFGSSFGSISFGNVAQAGLSEDVVLGDLTVVGSLEGGGSLGDVDLIYIPIPEPSAMVLLGLGMAVMLIRRRR